MISPLSPSKIEEPQKPARKAPVFRQDQSTQSTQNSLQFSNGKASNGCEWVTLASPVQAVALFDFEECGPQNVFLNMGDDVLVMEEAKDWYRGINLCCDLTGIFPKSYVQILSEAPQQQVWEPERDTNLAKVKKVIVEWETVLNTFQTVNPHSLFKPIPFSFYSFPSHFICSSFSFYFSFSFFDTHEI